MKYLLLVFCCLPILIHAQNKVGINVDTPSVELDIRSLSVADGSEISVGNIDNSNFTRLFSGRPGFPNSLLYWKTGYPLLLGTAQEDGASWSEWMRISPTGQVGIGIVNPVADLHIKDPGFVYLTVESDLSNDAIVQLRDDAAASLDAQWTIRRDGSDSGKLQWRHDNQKMMTLTPAGKLGIGTTNPEARLDILGGDWNLDAGNPGDLRIGSSAANAFRIGVATGGGGAGTARLYSNGGAIRLGTNNTTHLTITNEGNIGIGTTGPGNKLRVHGSSTSSQNVLSVSSNYTGTSNVRAVEGFSNALAGYGIGGYFRGGVRGAQVYGDGGSSSGLVIGIEARATGTAGTRMGVFASASGDGTNWAGYFAEGDVYVTNQLRIGDADGASGYRLSVDGKIIAEEVRVMLSGAWPDYVFKEDYHLLPLGELKNVIADKGHLPGVPSASEVDAEGADLGEMQRIMMEKIEELTLYVIQQDEKIRDLQQKLVQSCTE